MDVRETPENSVRKHEGCSPPSLARQAKKGHPDSHCLFRDARIPEEYRSAIVLERESSVLAPWRHLGLAQSRSEARSPGLRPRPVSAVVVVRHTAERNSSATCHVTRADCTRSQPDDVATLLGRLRPLGFRGRTLSAVCSAQQQCERRRSHFLECVSWWIRIQQQHASNAISLCH